MVRDLIYDVGMHNGDDTAYYLHRGFRVVAVEADPTMCADASARFHKDIERGRLTILNLGIAAQPGPADFWICDGNSVWNSFDRRIASRDGLPHHAIQVHCQPFGWVLANYGVPYYLKVDIEGHDHLCIEALPAARDLPKYISLELGDIDSFLATLGALGYRHYKCVSQFKFQPVEVTPPRERRRERWPRLSTAPAWLAGTVRRASQRWIGPGTPAAGTNEWVFPLGSSGPFAEETCGRWLSAEEVRHAYFHYLKAMEEGKSGPFWTDKEYSFWMDLHARRGR